MPVEGQDEVYDLKALLAPVKAYSYSLYCNISKLQGRDHQADNNFVRCAMRGLEPGFAPARVGQLRRRLLDIREWKEELAAKPMKVCKRFKPIHIFLI